MSARGRKKTKGMFEDESIKGGKILEHERKMQFFLVFFSRVSLWDLTLIPHLFNISFFFSLNSRGLLVVERLIQIIISVGIFNTAPD